MSVGSDTDESPVTGEVSATGRARAAVSGNRSLVRGFFTLLGGSAFPPALALVTAPLVARMLGVSGRGSLAAGLALFGVLRVLAVFGAPHAYLHLADRLGAERSVLRLARSTVFGAAIALAIVTALAAPWLLSGDDAAVLGFRLMVVALPLVVASEVARSALVRHHNYRASARADITGAVLRTALIVALYLVGVDTVGPVAAATMVALFVGALVLQVGFGRLPIVDDETLASRQILRALAAPQLFISSSYVARILARRLDQVVLLAVAGDAEVGVYAVGVVVAEVAEYAGRAVFPIAMAELGRTERETTRPGFLVVGVAALTLVIAIGLAVVVVPLIPWAFGAEFAPARSVTLLLLLSAPVLSARDALSVALVSRGFVRRDAVGHWIGAAAGLALLVPLARSHGADGAAIASLAGYGAGFLALLVSARRSFAMIDADAPITD